LHVELVHYLLLNFHIGQVLHHAIVLLLAGVPVEFGDLNSINFWALGDQLCHVDSLFHQTLIVILGLGKCFIDLPKNYLLLFFIFDFLRGEAFSANESELHLDMTGLSALIAHEGI